MSMKIFRVIDPQIGSFVGQFAALTEGAALDLAAARMGWNSYAEYVASAEKLFEANPGAGIRTLEVEQVSSLQQAA